MGFLERDWIHLTQDRNIIIDLRAPQKAMNLLANFATVGLSRGTLIDETS